MRVVLTGKSNATDFYALMAVSEQLTNIIDEKNLADIGVYLFSDKQHDKKMVYENGISFKSVIVGKSKFSLKTIIGFIQTFIMIFSIFPDVVLAKGGMPSYPVLLSAKLLRIPVIIHESHSKADEINLWASKFAHKVTVSFKQVAQEFKRDDIIQIGQPILNNLKNPSPSGAHEFLNLEMNIPVLWVMNGENDDSDTINNVTEESLEMLLMDFQIIHQVGSKSFENIKKITDAMLMNHPFKYRYHSFPELNILSRKMLAGITDIAILRPDSNLFDIAYWGIPSIVIPSVQSKNNIDIRDAYNYARSGACVVIEENNLNNQSYVFEINRIYGDLNVKKDLSDSAKAFTIKQAGKNLAEEIVGITLTHEK